MSFKSDLGEYFKNNGDEISEKLCEGLSLNIVESVSISEELTDAFGNNYELKIILTEVGG